MWYVILWNICHLVGTFNIVSSYTVRNFMWPFVHVTVQWNKCWCQKMYLSIVDLNTSHHMWKLSEWINGLSWGLNCLKLPILQYVLMTYSKTEKFLHHVALLDPTWNWLMLYSHCLVQAWLVIHYILKQAWTQGRDDYVSPVARSAIYSGSNDYYSDNYNSCHRYNYSNKFPNQDICHLTYCHQSITDKSNQKVSVSSL
jgi:hypothetical protein